MPYPSVVHDFCITDTRAVLMFSPMLMPALPLKYLMALQPMASLLRWVPELGARVVTVNLENGATTCTPTDSIVALHTVNAFDTPDGVVLDVCGMDDMRGLDLAEDVLRPDPIERVMPTVRRIRISHLDEQPDACGHAGVADQELLPGAVLDFPQVAPHVQNSPHTHVYGIGWPDDRAFIGVPSRYDVSRGTLATAPMAAGEYAGECIAVSKRNPRSDLDVYLLSVVLNARAERSELRVYDGRDLGKGAVCSLALPQPMLFGFHGSWQPG